MEFNFGPSSGLAEQIGSGAPADVFASASPSNMDTVVQGGDAKDPKDFATNSMEIAVPPDNPGKIASLADLAKPGVKVALCQAQVPCGKVAAEVFANAGLTVKPVTEEVDVKSVLTKVTLGEVDAGVVYVTDVLAAGDDVKGVEIPADVKRPHDLPDRHPRGIQAPEGGRRVRRPGALRRRRQGARGSRLPEPLMARPQRDPVAAGCPALIGALLLVVPLVGLLVRAPWNGLGRILGTEEVLDALWLSLFSATLAMLVSLVLGVPLAWVLARSTMPGLRLLRALVTLPLVLPPVVGGVALLLVLGRNGLVGQHLDAWFGITIPFTTRPS